MFFDEYNMFENYKNETENNFLSLNINDFNVFNIRKNENKLFNVEEGFNKGNMFSSIYDKYNNHDYKIQVNSERDKLLLYIQMLDFALSDIQLYLDLNPNDLKILSLFNKYNSELKNTKVIFEKEYGPLESNSIDYKNNFSWIDNPWPWDKGGNY